MVIMKTSLLDIFKVGIGPSSSHTVGPMLAAGHFVQLAPPETARICAHLYGSLALTGRGHATDRAVLLGLCGELPDTVDLDCIEAKLGGLSPERFQVAFHTDEWMPEHPTVCACGPMIARAICCWSRATTRWAEAPFDWRGHPPPPRVR